MRLSVKKILWQFPDGLVWKITEKPTLLSRKKKFELFIHFMTPSHTDKIIDIGVAAYTYRGTNFLEQWYEHRKNITALVNEDLSNYSEFRKTFPECTLIRGDGRKLDFPDRHFDIVFCNAVVEHVGSREKQKQFINELVRIGKKSFITTPNRWFLIDFHTLVPFAHWFPVKVRAAIYKVFGRNMYASEKMLNLLSFREFKELFSKKHGLKILRQRFLGFFTVNFVAVVDNSTKN
jgi:hypothetical protein